MIGAQFRRLAIAAVLSSLSVTPADAQENDNPPPILRMKRLPAIVLPPEPAPAPSAPAPSAPAPATTTTGPPVLAPVTAPIRTIQVRRVPILQPREQARTEIVPPATVNRQVRPGAVVLKAGPSSAVMKTLVIRSQRNLQQIRSNPKLALGSMTADMAPLLANPKALFNVAQSLRRQATIADVIAEDTQVYEVDQGLIIHSFLSYRIKPGACGDPARRAALSRSGIGCAGRLTAAGRAAAFGSPSDARYIADVNLRGQMIAKAEQLAQVDDAAFSSDIVQLRAALADPAQSAAIDAERGPGEAARLATLSDDALKDEAINSGETEIEQTAFVPNADRVDQTTGSKLIDPAAPKAKPVVNVETPLKRSIFISGFTLGKAYEWKQGISKTIKRCLVGCSKTYYAEASAGFSFAFGLRFPIELGGLYSYHEENGAKSAKVRVDFAPINGSVQDYRDAAMPDEHLHEGKELVAEIGGHAGFAADLPLTPNINLNVDPKLDFTTLLPGDFYLGQITPPAPNAANPPKFEKLFEEIDLLGGSANFGIVGVRLLPAVKVELTSQSLTFILHDFGTNGDTELKTSGQEVDLSIKGADNVSSFTIGDPVYELGFDLTPGINARFFINIAVWSNNWDFPVWFPQLTMHLPPGGASFGCHEETICTRRYDYAPKFSSESAGPKGQGNGELLAWGKAFDGRWMSECADETCRFGVRFVRQGHIYGAGHKFDANPALTMQSAEIVNYLAGADGEVKPLLNDSQARQTTSALKSFGNFWTIWWSKQCSDTICFNKVKGLTFFAQLEGATQQSQHPDMSTNEVIGLVGKKFAPVYESLVKESKQRFDAEEAAQAARAAKQGMTPVRIIPGVMRFPAPAKSN